jgi:hypothetical protein
VQEILETVKVPGPVNVWILKSPHSVSVPPDATIKGFWLSVVFEV